MRTLASVLVLAGLLAVDFIYLRWAWLGEPPAADIPARIAIGVVLALVTALTLHAALHAIAAATKGSLRLRFDDRPYTWGDSVVGEVALTTRRRLQLERLTVTLRGWQEVSRGQNQTSSRRLIFEFAQDIEVQQTLPVDRRTYPFKVPFPSSPPQSTLSWPSGMEQLGKLLAPVIAASGTHALFWELEARARLPGADLRDEHRVRFNSATSPSPATAS